MARMLEQTTKAWEQEKLKSNQKDEEIRELRGFNAEWRLHLDKVNHKHHQEIEEMKGKHAAEVQELKSKHAAEIVALKKERTKDARAHEQRVSEIKTQLDKDLKAEIVKITRAGEGEIARLIRKNDDALQEVREKQARWKNKYEANHADLMEAEKKKQKKLKGGTSMPLLLTCLCSLFSFIGFIGSYCVFVLDSMFFPFV